MRGGIHRILVLGERDVGKSMFCRFLVDQALQSGRCAALLDADVGQKIVGPPACVTLKDREGMKLAFVGTPNPVLGWTRLAKGLRRLAGETRADLTIVNTSGLLAGPGRKLKAAKIEALRPDLLIPLGGNPDLEAILGDHREKPVLRLKRSPDARRKTDGERRTARREAFQRQFATGSVLALDSRKIQPAPEGPLPLGLLVGLTDEHGREQGLGIVKGWSSTTITILTPVDGGIAGLLPGSVCLDERFSEFPANIPPQVSIALRMPGNGP